MNKVNQFLVAIAMFFCLTSCQKDIDLTMSNDSEIQQLVFLNDEPTPLSQIDYDDDNLVVLFLEENEEFGRMYTDENLMKAWISKHDDSQKIIESLTERKELAQYIKDNNLDDESVSIEKRQSAIDQYVKKIYGTDDRLAVKITIYHETNYSGPSSSHYGPSIGLALGSFANNVRSFKAWGTSISGNVSFFSNPNLGGAQLYYYRAYFKKRNNLGGFNNDIESFVNL